MTQITSVFTGTRKSSLSNSDYMGSTRPRTVGNTGKYSNITRGIDRSDSLTRPITDAASFNMDPLQQPNKLHEGKVIHVTSTWDVESR